MTERVYLVAYACEPEQGGEHEVGWRIANELADKCTLTVITRKSNRPLIEKYNWRNINVCYIEFDSLVGIKPKGRFSYMYYFLWQCAAYMHLRKRVTCNDIVHYLTFGNIHLPHCLFLLHCKLVLGPMGGGSVVDTTLLRNPSLLLRFKSRIHKWINATVKFNPLYHLVFAKASKIILRTDETRLIIPSKYHSKCTVFLETGVDVDCISGGFRERELRHIITTSRIITSKNVDQVIEVFQHLSSIVDMPLRLSILGDGPVKEQLEMRYSKVQGVSFIGKVPHSTVAKFLQEADLFLFCSIKEGGSHSLFEAAMNNIPIACYDVSGMKEFPKSDASIKILPSSNIDINTRALAAEIKRNFFEDNVDTICKKATMDLRENYDWKVIAEKYLRIYSELTKK